MPTNPFPSGRSARNANPNVPVESYSQPAPQVTEAQATNYPAASPSPAAPGFLGQIPSEVHCFGARNPYDLSASNYDPYPVNNAPGDTSISKSPAPYFMAKNPYNRAVEGENAHPKDPREASPTSVSYSGSHE